MTAIAHEARVENTAPVASQFVQYLFLHVDPDWRRLDRSARDAGREEFAAAIAAGAPRVTTHAYSTLGLKARAQILLWWKSENPTDVQDTLAALLSTGLGRYCDVTLGLSALVLSGRLEQYDASCRRHGHGNEHPRHTSRW